MLTFQICPNTLFGKRHCSQEMKIFLTVQKNVFILNL